MCNIIRRWSLQWIPKKSESARNMDISFMVNSLSLGNFTKEEDLESQDNISADLLTAKPNVLTPKSFKKAIASPEKLQWEDAIQTELCNMKDMGVYDILPLQKDTHVLGGGWVFVNTPSLFKARYVAWGIQPELCSNRYIHLNETNMDNNICVRPPHRLHVPTGFGCKLGKALYGTTQAGYFWWHCGAERLTTLGYTASNFDKSLNTHKLQKAIIWLHADDIIIAAEDKGLLLQLPNELGTWDGTLSTKTPLPAKYNLVTLPDNIKVTHPMDYIGTLGALSYVATGTRPEILYAVSLLARHTTRPGTEHWKCLQHLLGYMHHKKSLSLCLEAQQGEPQLDVVLDASWGG
ncbi:hypothetical protein O181_115580 [Austropuccinia psidii MF-1]|uniref:Reverse transcriptase Ty1/copia-type domain-containing protein n=1 Tax=Austropuccinia psidii MF-1 TaxID=1389203 RepID=A0A9Q3K6Q6_9BASI|nr:hypothetical protein [Austropuccinia psidii MF-1]